MYVYLKGLFMKIKKNIILMYAICFLQGMVFYSSVATMYRQAVGVTIFQIAIIESVSLFLSFLLELPWGIVADWIGYKNTLILCNVLFLISKIVFWLANGFAMFLLERILLSIVIAGLSGVDESLLYLSCKEDYFQKAIGWYTSLGTAGMLLASGLFAAFFASDYRFAALCTVIVYGIAALLTLFLQEVKEESTDSNPKLATQEFFSLLKSTLRNRSLLFFLIGTALFFECRQTIGVFLNQLQYVRCGMSNQLIGIAYILTTIAGFISVISANYTKRLGRRKGGFLLFLVGGISCLVLILTRNRFLSIGAILLLVMSASLLGPLVSTIENELITHDNRATALSINAVLTDTIAIGTNLCFGKASDCNLSLAFGMGVAFSLIGGVLFLYGTRNFKKSA